MRYSCGPWRGCKEWPWCGRSFFRFLSSHLASTLFCEGNHMASWFVSNDGKEHGPFTSEQLKQLATSGQVRPETPIRRDDKQIAIRASEIKGLFAVEPTSQAAPLPPPRTAPSRQEVQSPLSPLPFGVYNQHPNAPSPQYAYPQPTAHIPHRPAGGIPAWLWIVLGVFGSLIFCCCGFPTFLALISPEPVVPPGERVGDTTKVEAPPKPVDNRSRWINESYNSTISHVQGGEWSEVDDKTQQVRWSLKETARTPEYIELVNEKQNQTWRLSDSRMTLQSGTDWTWLANGRWEVATPKELVVAKPEQKSPQSPGQTASSNRVAESGFKLGDTFKLGDYRYQITSVERKSEIGREIAGNFVGQRATPGGTFIVVTYLIVNDTQESKTVLADDFKIIDAKGRTYQHSARATTALVMNREDKEFLLSQLQPGLTKEMQQGFEIPLDAAEGAVTIVVPKKGAFSRGEAKVSATIK